MLAEAVGFNKKETKQAAAKSLLDVFAGVTIAEDFYYSPKKQQGSTGQESSANFVGRLQTFCDNNKIRYPVYELLSEQGPAHAKEFTVSCTLESLNTSGSSNSIRLTRQKAAAEMLKLLNEQSLKF